VYKFVCPNYYEPMEDREVGKNTNIDVFDDTEENYLKSSKYAEA
jgi:hypothetical protein